MEKHKGTKEKSKKDPVIVYIQSDKQYIRARGRTGKQAPVALKQAAIFGMASTISARLRAAFKPLIPGPGNRKLINRLNYALQQWLRSGQPAQKEPLHELPFIRGFTFSEAPVRNPFQDLVSVNRTTENTISLVIPALKASRSGGKRSLNEQVKLEAIAASCNLNNPADTKIHEATKEVPYKELSVSAQEILLQLKTEPAHLTAIALKVNQVNLGIVGALYN